MIEKTVEISLRERGYVLLATVLLAVVGIWSANRVAIDAIPDITNIQVQINTEVPVLAPEEVEVQVTLPIEREMAGLPGMVELRSLSRFGLSQVTMTFEDDVDVYRLRQLVTERLQPLLDELPEGVEPRLAPIATGLGEIFYYTVEYREDAKTKPSSERDALIELRLIQDYLVRPLLRATRGLAEVNTSGGLEKQILVVPDTTKLALAGVSLRDFSELVHEGLENAGGGAVEIGNEQIVIRTTSRATTSQHIASIPVKFAGMGKPLTVGDLASIEIATLFRSGASTSDGKEAVVGGAIMLMGENSRLVARDVRAKVEEIQTKLPEGVTLRIQYDRADLVNRTISTVKSNLFEGAVLVVVVLFLMLGNWKAALLVASVIPLAMLFALTGMAQSRISGNLMSLGAIDFGLLVDGAVVMVENIVRHLSEKQKALGRVLSAQERLKEVLISAREVARPMFFGVLIVTAVYVPILALTGIEGKMFRPMAMVVIFAMLGGLILALTLMPVGCSFILTGKIEERESALVRAFKFLYRPLLGLTLRFPVVTVLIAALLVFGSVRTFGKLGAEFIPQLDEGSLSLQMIRSSSLGIDTSISMQKRTEKYILKNFPEISHLFSRIGTAEIATDPMGPNLADTYMFLSPNEKWRQEEGVTISKERLVELMRDALTRDIPGQSYLFTQPIQMRFNEIMAGARANLALKIYGPEFETLERLASEAIEVLREMPGSGDVEFDPLGRLPSIEVSPRRDAMSKYNVHGEDINDAVRIALGGEEVGRFIEGNRQLPIVVRLDEKKRQNRARIEHLPVVTEDGGVVPLKGVADVIVKQSIGSIARESNQRRAAILINPTTKDIEGFVEEATEKLRSALKLPSDYYFEFGGQYRNLIAAKKRLSVVVPICLAIILTLIFFTTHSFLQTGIIFLSVPLAVTGGVFALSLRELPFSISAAVGFIALSGIAVLNGLMLISFINQLRDEGKPLYEAVVASAVTRLRPKLMTALVASLGFVPMAIATGPGAEVQRPLATVVIGGIITSTFLSLLLLPTLYLWIERGKEWIAKRRMSN